MSKESVSAWFRWLTPILLGVMTASNARIHTRIDSMEESMGKILDKAAAYTDKVAAPLAQGIKEHTKEIADLRVDIAKAGRRWPRPETVER